MNMVFLFVSLAFVFLAQVGFAMLETGLTRAKNAGNTILKKVMGFSVGSIAFTLIGFGLMQGNGNPLIGDIAGIASAKAYGIDMLPEGIPFSLFLIFQTVLAGTAVTILSGGMSERTKFSAYCICALFMGMLVYPMEARWIWHSQGWLNWLGFHDLAGGTAIHLCGGLAALLGARMVGPRTGKYGKDGKARAIQGHSIPLAALGFFLLWFCWFGFAGGMVGDLTAETVQLLGKILVNVNLSAAVCVCTVILVTWLKYGKPDVILSLNGILMGLVVISAGADTVSPVSAMVIAILAGVLMVFAMEYIDEVLKIDDPTGAVTVHGIGGAMGTLMVGLFSDGAATRGMRGLLLGGGFRLLGVQLLGVVAVAAWVGVTIYLVLKGTKKGNGLRVSAEDEMLGLDGSENGLMSAYPNFALLPDPASFDYTEETVKQIPVPATKKEEAPEEDEVTVTKKGRKLTQVTIICNQAKLEALKEGLNAIGVSGITITNVMGCGVQKGRNRYFRGIPVGMQLLPKIRVDVVVAKIPVEKIVETARKILYTGNIGDGKIFVYDVENVIKVRTGEEGYVALQYSDVIWDEHSKNV